MKSCVHIILSLDYPGNKINWKVRETVFPFHVTFTLKGTAQAAQAIHSVTHFRISVYHLLSLPSTCQKVENIKYNFVFWR